MHLFYTPDIEGDIYTLNADESRHCVRVLRLGAGEAVSLVDGKGTWYEGVIERAEVRGCEIRITDRRELYGRRNFHLHLAVAPTKNIDRIEWMLEKCTEMGIDEITLLHAAHSERKAYLPRLNPMTDFRQLVTSCRETHKFIAHCNEGDKKRLDEVYRPGEDVVILIGPEGDFSEEEVVLARHHGFVPVTLGTSRLRTETAGIVACHSIDFMNRV